MPILERAPEDAPLDQGDILSGLDLCYSQVTDGGQVEPAFRKSAFALVVSRPCGVAHKDKVLLAVVEKVSDALPAKLNDLEFEKLVTLIRNLRDADGSDRFYLGELPDQAPQRMVAHLDFVVALKLPKGPDARKKWTLDRRIARLHADFRRDLHTRLFLSFAKQGFDDDNWWSDKDLDLVIGQGEVALAERRRVLAVAEQEIRGAEGNGTYEVKKVGLEKTRKEAAEGAAKVEADLKPLRDEAARRRTF